MRRWTSGLAVLALTSFFNAGWLHSAPVNDDITFLRVLRGTPAEWASFFSPHWGWFYRPVFLVYLSCSFQVTHRDIFLIHLLSLAVHALTAATLGLLVARISRLDYGENKLCDRGAAYGELRGEAAGWIAAIAYVVTPATNNAVSWLSSNSAILATLFGLLTMHFWLWYRQSERWPWLVAAATTFALALGCKEEALSIPLACLALDTLQRNCASRARLQAYWPMALVACGYAVLALAARHHISPYHPKIVKNVPTRPNLLAWVPLFHELWLHFLATGAMGVNCAVVVVGLWAVWRQQLLRTLYLWMLVCIVPIACLLGWYALADRFLYMPSAPAAALVACATIVGVERVKEWRTRRWFILLSTAAVVAAMRATLTSSLGFSTVKAALASPWAVALCALLLACATGLSFHRNWGERDVAVLLLVVLVATQFVERATALWMPAGMLLGFAAPLAAGALLKRQTAAPEALVVGSVITCLLWRLPAFSLPLYLAIMLLSHCSAPQGESLRSAALAE